jgi:hypothetical protein
MPSFHLLEVGQFIIFDGLANAATPGDPYLAVLKTACAGMAEN